jgi:iron complex outermembrane receptor protein
MGINADPCEVFLQGIAQEGVRDNTLSTYKANGCGGSANLQPQNGSYGASFFDFRLGTDYDIAPGRMAYLTVSTGHASGGFNDNLIYTDNNGNRQSRLSTYKPEMVVATEVGTKNEFFDRKLKANLALFEYEYFDQVLQSVVQVQTDPNNEKAIAGFAVRENIAHSRVIGAEIDSDLRLPHGFMVSFLGSFLYSRATSGEIFDGRVAYSPTGTDTDKTPIKGKTLPRSPLATVNLILSQHRKISAGWLDWMVSGQVRTKYYMTIFNGDGYDATGNLVPRFQDYQPAYFRADASVGYTRPDGKTRIEAFITNATNVAYMTSLISSPDVHIRYYNPPRQIGTRITMAW